MNTCGQVNGYFMPCARKRDFPCLPLPGLEKSRIVDWPDLLCALLSPNRFLNNDHFTITRGGGTQDICCKALYLDVRGVILEHQRGCTLSMPALLWIDTF